MNTRSGSTHEPKQNQDEGKLEKLANLIDPAGRNISDDELSDPGTNTPEGSTKTDRNDQKKRDTR